MKEIRLLNSDEIDARVATVNQKGCSLILYKDARCDMRLLDETFGPMNWTRSHEVIDGNLYCNVSVWDEEKKTWITKQDVGVESYTEKEKGQASDAFKRACFNFGIGRELYTAPFIWVNLTDYDLNAQGKIKTTFKVQSIGYNEKREINRLVIVDDKRNVRYEMGKVIKPKEEPNNIDNDMLAMALQEIGVPSVSLTGWQAGFNTDRAYSKARIKRLDTERVESELARNRVVVVAGFQGLNKLDDITTLGRGGSDTSAVAIAAALHADRCQIFTDVEGVYTADPRKVRNTRKLDEITFDEMLELASLGAQVLNNRSVELAKKYNVELEVLSSLNPVPGTVVKEVVKDVEGMLIKGVAKDTDVAVITILNVPDEPGTSFKIFGLLAQKNINVDIILQSTGRDGKKDISFTCAESEAETALRVLRESARFDQVTCDETCAKVSIVGAGMQSHSGVASKMFEALSNNNINIKMISTSEIKISCIIDREDADKAVSAIHDMLFE